MTKKSNSMLSYSADPQDTDDFDMDPEVVLAAQVLRALRLLRTEQLDLSQRAFADRYALSLGTLRDWEQGRNQPSGTVLAYLQLILDDPDRAARVVAA